MVFFYFIRHGLSCSNITQGDKLHMLTGVNILDPGLDDLGIKHSKKISATKFVRSLRPWKGQVYVSPMSRALQTATIMFNDHPHTKGLKVSRDLHELHPITPSNRNMSLGRQLARRSRPFSKMVFRGDETVLEKNIITPVEHGAYANKAGDLNKFMTRIMKENCKEFHENPNAQIVVVTHGGLLIRDLHLNKKRDNLNNMIYVVDAQYVDDTCVRNKKSQNRPAFRGFSYDMKKFDPVACRKACPYYNEASCKKRKVNRKYVTLSDALKMNRS